MKTIILKILFLVCVLVGGKWARACRCPQGPEEGVRAPEAGVTGGCACPAWVLGIKIKRNK